MVNIFCRYMVRTKAKLVGFGSFMQKIKKVQKFMLTFKNKLAMHVC